MKKCFITLLWIISLLGAETVSSVQQFIKSIGDNKEIILAAGEYILSDPIDDKSSAIYTRKCYDGTELVISGISNLTIKGSDYWGSHLITNPKYGYVLVLKNCENVTISNIKAGHGTGKGVCTGGVIRMEHCTNIRVESSFLYGCGTSGIDISESQNIIIDQTIITECSYRITSIFSSQNLLYTNCAFRNNQKYNQIVLSDAAHIVFKNCTFKQNSVEVDSTINGYGFLFDVDDSCKAIELYECIFEKNRSHYFADSADNLLLRQCRFIDNSFSKGTYRK